eukprot:TRINITY_DN2337_c0_g1_i13.p1 TRINITY_DN2337_c0_g1~~TRINITY_DN2337_c0_g1_i13.p1  ORF type:complete len:491 (-),score=74.25 TRINITY_DN2337_c0_g1_i13:123-1595(-)
MYGQTEKVLELLLLHSRFSDLEWHPVYPKTQISERLVHGQFGSDKDDKLFHQLRLLLQTKPTFSGNTQHHSALVNNWKKEVERFLSSRSLSKEPEIKELLKILAGHQSVIESHANSWIERLCAQVNYSHPLMTLGEFRSFIEGNQLQEVEPNSVDRVFTDIMQGKTREVLNFIYRTGAWWFSAHLADLLYHAGVVSPIEVDGETERERVILEYSASLMHNEGLVHLVSSYLHYGCPFRGTAYLKTALERVPIPTERHLFRLLGLCERFQLGREFESVLYKNAAGSLMRQKLYCKALKLYILCGDLVRSRVASNLLLDELIKPIAETEPHSVWVVLSALQIPLEGDAPHLSSLASNGDLFTRNWLFLRSYYLIIEAWHKSDWPRVQLGIISSMEKRIVPNRFLFSLLIDCTGLMTLQRVLFGVSETYVLMGCLEQLVMSFHEQYHLPLDKLGPREMTREQLIQSLRLAFSTNLSKAILSNCDKTRTEGFLK